VFGDQQCPSHRGCLSNGEEGDASSKALQRPGTWVWLLPASVFLLILKEQDWIMARMNWWEEIWSLKAKEKSDNCETKEIAFCLWPCISHLIEHVNPSCILQLCVFLNSRVFPRSQWGYKPVQLNFACSLNRACIKSTPSKALQLSVEMNISCLAGNNEHQIQCLCAWSFSTYLSFNLFFFWILNEKSNAF